MWLIFRRAFYRKIRVPETGHSELSAAVESCPLGRQRQLVLIQRGGKEHLILRGGAKEVAIETGLAPDSCDFSKSDEREPFEMPPQKWRSVPALSLIRAERIYASSGLLSLAIASGLAGAGAGLICGLFRLALETADRLRTTFPTWWQGGPLLGCLVLIAIAAAAGASSAFLVRRFSTHAAGSGIPHVEAVLNGELPPAPFILIPVKFVGGLLSIGAGFALGREGPSVQMGAAFANLLGRIFGLTAADCCCLLAAGAGAGLAAAFNAPLAGSAFVLEELVRKFETRHAIAALGASGSAIVAARLLMGPKPMFEVAAITDPGFSGNLLCFALGIIAGLLGVAYNRVHLEALALSDRLAHWPVEVRAAIVGAGAGALAWFAPSLAGGGELLAQRTLDGHEPLAILPFLFLLRLLLGAASYSAGTPGGLFAPLLVLGAQTGFSFGAFFNQALPFAIVGMAALFAAIVRAPLTGMILVTEMTASSMLLLPMLAACFSAMAVATLLRQPPIYDSLKKRTLRLASKEPSDLSRGPEPGHSP